MLKLFFSYSHRDEVLRNELEIHLATLRREGVVEIWHDRRIGAGKEFEGEISEHLESADIILLLVSPYFIASDYCFDVEMRRALERHEAGETRVIPVVLHPCDWHHTPFGKLLAVPQDGKPVSKYPNQHDALLEVTIAVRRAADELGHHSVSRPKAVAPHATPKAVHRDVRSSNLRIRKEFSDSERDAYLDSCFEYAANFFEGSLAELQTRNNDVEGRFRRIDANHFTALIYVNGTLTSKCKIWLGGFGGRHNQIHFSFDASGGDNSFNEGLSVSDDGYCLFMKPLGMGSANEKADSLSENGAAEYLWRMLMRPLQ